MRTSNNLRVENRGPLLKTLVSRKTAFVDDSSCVNFIVGKKELAKSAKSRTSLVGMAHRLKTSSMNFVHTEGLKQERIKQIGVVLLDPP